MEDNLQEQAYWLLLVFESGLTIRLVNTVLVAWCKQQGRTLREFFAASAQEWKDVCRLNAEDISKLEQAREKLVGQVFLAEQLDHAQIHLLTVLDPAYPPLLKQALKGSQIPSVLFYAGDLRILERKTVAIIGSRNAGETSLAFTREVAQYLARNGANVISGNARGVDRAAYEGAMSGKGCTTVVLPHGMRKLSKAQMSEFQMGIDAGNVLVVSQFHPDASWLVSRAMERNKVVTGLAEVVIVAESDVKGGTWEGAKGALQQKRELYVREPDGSASLPGNKALIEQGGNPLHWPVVSVADVLSPLLHESAAIHQGEHGESPVPSQLSLFAVSNE